MTSEANVISEGEQIPVTETASAVEPAVEVPPVSLNKTSDTRTDSGSAVLESSDHDSTSQRNSEGGNEAGEFFEMIEQGMDNDSLYESKTNEEDMGVDAQIVQRVRGAELDEVYVTQPLIVDKSEPVAVVETRGSKNETEEKVAVPQEDGFSLRENPVLPVYDSAPSQEFVPESLPATALDTPDEIEMTSVDVVSALQVGNGDRHIDRQAEVRRREDPDAQAVFGETHTEISLTKKRAVETDSVADKTAVALEVSENARDITAEITTEVEDIVVIRDDERVIFSGKKTQSERKEEGTVSSEFIPMTTVTELEGAIDMLMHLPKESPRDGQEKEVPDHKPAVFIVSDELLEMFEEMQREESFIDTALQLSAAEAESLITGEEDIQKEAVHIAIHTTDEKITVSKQIIEAGEGDEGEEAEAVPIDTYDDLQQAFDYLLSLPEEGDGEEGMIFSPPDAEGKSVSVQKEVIISGEIVELIQLFKEQIPPQEEDDAMRIDESDVKTIIFTTAGEGEKQISMSKDEMQHIKNIFTEHGLFTADADEKDDIISSFITESQDAAVLNEPIVPGHTVILFDSMRKEKREKSVEHVPSPEEMKKEQIVLSSGKKEITIDRELLEKLVQIRKKKIQKMIELQKITEKEESPEEMKQNSMQYRKGYIPPAHNYQTIVLFMALLDKQVSSAMLIRHQFYASPITAAAS